MPAGQKDLSKSDSSCRVPPMFNQLEKHRPPRRLRSYCRSAYRIFVGPTKACSWPLTYKQQQRSGDLLRETATLCTHTEMYIHKKKGEEKTERKKGKKNKKQKAKKNRRRERKRESTTSLTTAAL